MNQALVLIGNNFEETEAVAVIDILRRAKVKVVVASINEHEIIGSHGIVMKIETLIDDINSSEYSLVYCPGGPGTAKLREDKRVLKIISDIYTAGGYAAALCAAPTVLAAAGILKGKKATFFPGSEALMDGAELSDEPVVVDGKIITGQAAGSAITFAITLVAAFLGKDAADQLVKSMYIHWM